MGEFFYEGNVMVGIKLWKVEKYGINNVYKDSRVGWLLLYCIEVF